MIELLEEGIITPKPVRKTTPKIGKARENKQIPSVSVCAHRQELVEEYIPEFEHKCHKCGKGFRHENNLLRHMTCHSKRVCECAYPCIPSKAPTGTPLEAPQSLTSEAEPEIGPSDHTHEQEAHKYDDMHKVNNDRHISNDAFVLSYTCNDCGRGFSKISNLTIHRRSHNQSNNAKLSDTCTRCNK